MNIATAPLPSQQWPDPADDKALQYADWLSACIESAQRVPDMQESAWESLAADGDVLCGYSVIEAALDRTAPRAARAEQLLLVVETLVNQKIMEMVKEKMA